MHLLGIAYYVYYFFHLLKFLIKILFYLFFFVNIFFWKKMASSTLNILCTQGTLAPSTEDRMYSDGSVPIVSEVTLYGPWSITSDTYQPLIIPSVNAAVPQSQTTVLTKNAYVSLKNMSLKIFHDNATTNAYYLRIRIATPSTITTGENVYNTIIQLKQNQTFEQIIPNIEKIFVPKDSNVYITLGTATGSATNATIYAHATIIVDDK